MEKDNKPLKAEPNDHNDHLPKDVLNLAQDENSFRDPLQQQLEKSGDAPNATSNTNKQDSDKKA